MVIGDQLKFPCEIVVKEILPMFRAILAKKLVNEHGFSQTQVALLLGTSQTSINYYLSAKRGSKKSKNVEELEGLEETIEKIADNLAHGELTHTQSLREFCDVCRGFRTRGAVCQLHETALPTIRGKDCRVCVEFPEK